MANGQRRDSSNKGPGYPKRRLLTYSPPRHLHGDASENKHQSRSFFDRASSKPRFTLPSKAVDDAWNLSTQSSSATKASPQKPQVMILCIGLSFVFHINWDVSFHTWSLNSWIWPATTWPVQNSVRMLYFSTQRSMLYGKERQMLQTR